MEKKINGEKEIEKILTELKVKFDRKKKLKNLKKDTKKFRVPDFYLEEYSLVIEYFGGWDNKKNKALEKRERARFMEKVGAYEESGVNCVYLYPEDLPVLKEKILKKINSIKESRKAKEISKTITTKKEIIINEKVKPIEKKPIIVKDNPTNPFIKKEINKNKPLFKKIIIGLDLIALLLLLFMIIITILILLEGNPLISDLYPILDFLFFTFTGVIILSIIFSALFALEKNISKGFIYVSIILIAFFLILLWFFGDPLTKIIIIMIGAIVIIPGQYYLINTN
ncbi:MAG: hypothetical protein PHX27_03625 [Candidatus ainarchaeum sp.]|nr:hypothetical protein [Candidatus ainarchaeum sp.]